MLDFLWGKHNEIGGASPIQQVLYLFNPLKDRVVEVLNDEKVNVALRGKLPGGQRAEKNDLLGADALLLNSHHSRELLLQFLATPHVGH